MPTGDSLAWRREAYRRNFARFAADQLKIRSRQAAGLIPLRLNGAQQVVDAKLEAQRKRIGYMRGILLKPRRLGGSTYGQARLFHSASLTSNYQTLLIAQDKDTTEVIFQMVTLFWEEMEEWLRPARHYASKKELTFANPDKKARQSGDPGLRSRMAFQTAGTTHAGTGTLIHGLHLSEMGKYPPDKVDDLLASLMPTVHPGPGSIILKESTAFVGGQRFRDDCDMAREGDASGWVFIFIPWWMDNDHRVALEPGEVLKLTPEEKRTQRLAERGQPKDDVPPMVITPEQFKFRRQKIIELGPDGEDLFCQEYPGTYEEAWISRELHVFDPVKVALQKPNICRPEVMGGRFIEIHPDGTAMTNQRASVGVRENYCAIWKEPQRDHQYDIGVDVALGKEYGDWSVAEVVDRHTKEQVGEYHKHIDVYPLAEEVVGLARFFTQGSGRLAQLIPEVNGGYGMSAFQRIQQIGYPYVYWWRHRDDVVQRLSNKAGWFTTRETKKQLLTELQHQLHSGALMLHSMVLWDEMKNFVQFDEENSGAVKGHDDALMALGLAIIGGADETAGTREATEPIEQENINDRVKRFMEKEQPWMRDDRDRGQTPTGGVQAFVKESKGWA